jgi:DNA-binding transcriptional ArsR family regulator
MPGIYSREGPLCKSSERLSTRKRIALSADTVWTFPRFRNSGNVIEKPRGRGELHQSRLCRLLGNPVAFAVVQLLAENNELNPSEIARAVGRSVQRVSTVLGALRLAEVVRYDTDGKRNRYRLKHPSEVRNVLASLSRFVKVASVVNSE